jgi:hypothetical protein
MAKKTDCTDAARCSVSAASRQGRIETSPALQCRGLAGASAGSPVGTAESFPDVGLVELDQELTIRVLHIIRPCGTRP